VTKRQHTATYDALGERRTDVGGQSQTTSFTYDKNGNVQTITDPRGYISYRSVDQLNRLTRTKDGALNISFISYDSHSRPLTVTDPRGNKTTYVYDGFGDKIQQNSPDTLKTIFYYDADANLTGRNQSGLNFSSATYDALDRIATRTYPSASSLNVAFTYDQAGHGDGIGRLTSLTDAAGSLSQNFEERGLLTSSARTYSGTTYTTWVMGYTRDTTGQVTTVTATQPGHGATNLATSVKHMPFGPASSWTYGNGVTDTRTFDLDYRLTGVKDTGTGGNIQYLSYGYDATDNPLTITDNVTHANNQTLQYDGISQLKFASGPYGSVSGINYDSNSNRKAYGATTYTIPGLSDRMSVAGGSAVTYTSTGNVSAVGTNTMTYNQANQLASINTGSTWTYTTDAFGRRLSGASGASHANYEYGQNGAVFFESRSSTENDYVWLDPMPGAGDGFKPIAIIQPATATVSALHYDNIGTPLKATSSTQTLVYAVTLNPQGSGTVTTGTVTVTERYPNQFNDSTGYYINGLRTYSPFTYTPRYLQPDYIGLAGGLNPYPYAGNNPYKNIDPWGLQVVDPDPKAETETPEERAEEFFGPRLETDPNLESEISPLRGEQCTSQIGRSYGDLGTVVESPGIQANSLNFTNYSLYRAATRDATLEAIRNTVNNPLVVLQQSTGRYLFLSNQAAVAVTPSGTIVTTYSSQYFDPEIIGVLRRLIPLSQVDQYLGLAGRSRNRAEFDFFGRC
jgi:RHS repeat-associated protein